VAFLTFARFTRGTGLALVAADFACGGDADAERGFTARLGLGDFFGVVFLAATFFGVAFSGDAFPGVNFSGDALAELDSVGILTDN
jgi:hypothetical protein